MFVCEKCNTCNHPHPMGSYGRCEICELVRDCVDCPPYHVNDTN